MSRTYTLAEVRNGTGWPAGVRFILAPALPEARIVGRRRQVKAPELVCPACGGPLMNYYEDIANRRRVNGLTRDEDGTFTLDIDGFYETDGCDEGGDNPRLCCDACSAECSIPAAVELEFT